MDYFCPLRKEGDYFNRNPWLLHQVLGSSHGQCLDIYLNVINVFILLTADTLIAIKNCIEKKNVLVKGKTRGYLRLLTS